MNEREQLSMNYNHLKALLKSIGAKDEKWEEILLETALDLKEKSIQAKSDLFTHSDSNNNPTKNGSNINTLLRGESLFLGKNKNTTDHVFHLDSSNLGMHLNDTSMMWNSALATQEGLDGLPSALNVAPVVKIPKYCETSPIRPSPIDAITTDTDKETTPQRSINESLSMFFNSPPSKSRISSAKKPPRRKAFKRKSSPEQELEDCFETYDRSRLFFDQEETLTNNDAADTSDLMPEGDNIAHQNNLLMVSRIERIDDKEKVLNEGCEISESAALNASSVSFNSSPSFGRMRTSTPLRPPNKRTKISEPDPPQALPEKVSSQVDKKIILSNFSQKLKESVRQFSNNSNQEVSNATLVVTKETQSSKFKYPNKAQIEYFMTDNFMNHEKDLIDIPTGSIKTWHEEDTVKLKKYSKLNAKVPNPKFTTPHKVTLAEEEHNNLIPDDSIDATLGNIPCAGGSNISENNKDVMILKELHSVTTSFCSPTFSNNNQASINNNRNKQTDNKEHSFYQFDAKRSNNVDLFQTVMDEKDSNKTGVDDYKLFNQSSLVSFKSATGKQIQLSSASENRARALFDDVMKHATREASNSIIHFDTSHKEELEIVSNNADSAVAKSPRSLGDANKQLEVNESIFTLSQSLTWKKFKQDGEHKNIYIEEKLLKLDIMLSGAKNSLQGSERARTLMKAFEESQNQEVFQDVCESISGTNYLENTSDDLALVPFVPCVKNVLEEDMMNDFNPNMIDGSVSEMAAQSCLKEKNENIKLSNVVDVQSKTAQNLNLANDCLDNDDVINNKESLIDMDEIKNDFKVPDKSVPFQQDSTLHNDMFDMDDELVSKIFEDEHDDIKEGENVSNYQMPPTPALPPPEVPAFFSFTTASGNAVQVNAKSLENARSLLSEDDVDGDVQSLGEAKTLKDVPNVQNSFSCFQTAGGKVINTSESALKKVKSLFNNLDQVDFHEKTERMHPTTADEKSVNNSGEAFKQCGEFQPQDKNALPFFSTGRGKQVSVSKESLASAKTILDSFEDDGKCDDDGSVFRNKVLEAPQKSEHDALPCFSTGRGKQVNVSINALENAQKIMRSVENFESNERPLMSTIDKTNIGDSDKSVEINTLNSSANISQFVIPYKKPDSKENPAVNKTNNTKSSKDILAEERKNQALIIKSKLKNKNNHPILGSLSSIKSTAGNRITLLEAVSNNAPSLHSVEDLLDHGVMPATMKVCGVNAEDHKFYSSDMSEKDGLKTFITTDGGVVIPNESGELGKIEFHKALMAAPGVNPSSVDKQWTFNHYKWIVWKLASMEKAFPLEFGGRCLTVDVVFSQLKYRYDLELTLGRRSSLKKIFEKDDTPKKGIILCVADIQLTGNKRTPFKMLLTDGWYSIPAILDEFLNSLVSQSKIKIGTKLSIFGSELIGSNEACSPLDATEGISLKIHGNSVRRARWHCKLGFIYVPIPKFSLSSASESGGNIVCMDVLVLRSYPLLYFEKYPNGGKGVVRSSRLEKKVGDDFEAQQRKYAEKFYEKCEKEFQASLKNDASKFHQESENSDSCGSKDMTNNDEDTLNDFIRRKMDSERNVVPSRSVTPLLKVKIAGCDSKDVSSKRCAVLSIWNPNEEVMAFTSEGSRLFIYNAVAMNEKSDGVLHLNANRSTQYQRKIADEEVKKLIYQPRRNFKFKEISPNDDECDLVGLVVKISDKNIINHSLAGFVETVVMADEEGNMGAVIFEGGLNAHGLEGMISEGSSIACSNLRLFRRNSSNQSLRNQSMNQSSLNASFSLDVPSVVTFKASQLSDFSRRPAHKHLSAALDSLNKRLNSDKNFLEAAKKSFEEISSTSLRSKSVVSGKKLSDFDKNVSSIFNYNDSTSSEKAFEESFSADIKPVLTKARPSGLTKAKNMNTSNIAAEAQNTSGQANNEPFDFNGFSEDWF